jgi:predicted dehydrogenase
MSEPTEPIRWGILGTAGIAEGAFLPALAEAGGGTPLMVGSRDRARAERWAGEHGVAEGVEGYTRVLENARVEAVYIPLPNGVHAEWAIATLQAGKAVFCEKPLCATLEETEALLRVARTATGPLWEAFVFPFHAQTDRLRELIAAGTIGELREIRSSFHFRLDDEEDVRMLLELAGGSVQDVGCYSIRLARLLFDAEPELERTVADARWAPTGVDEECWGALAFPGDRRLLLSCGFRAEDDTSAVLLGTHGRIHLTNPFHPEPGDTITVVRDGHAETEPSPGVEERSFTPAIRHIHRAIRGLEAPRHLAVDEALGNAQAIAAVLSAARASAAR